MSQPLLELDDVRIDFEGRCVLESVSLATSGDRIGLLGEGGYLLEALSGAADVASGAFRVLGLDIEEARKSSAFAVARPWQPRANVSVYDGLVLSALLAGCTHAAAKHRAARAIDCVGLGQLSRQKLTRRPRIDHYLAGLAEAALFEPEVVVIDWPIGLLEQDAWARYGTALSKLIQRRRWAAWVPAPARHAVEQSWIGALDQLLWVESGLCVEMSGKDSERVRALVVIDAVLDALPEGLEQVGLQLLPVRLVSLPGKQQSAYVVELSRDGFGRPITEPLLGWCDRNALPLSRLEPLDRGL